jgi:protein involved in polysaccharide export with SLBB domain
MKVLRLAFAFALFAASASAAALAAIHPGDKIQISVYNHPELATSATVDAQGRVSMALVGSVDAAGMDEKALATRIQDKLAHYMKYPAVEVVTLAQSPDIFIAGGPGGTIQYRPGDTLSTGLSDLSIACKCSLSDTSADLHHVRIVRNGMVVGQYDASSLQTSGDAGPALLPGDRVAFAAKPVAVTVKGEVKSPGIAYLYADEPLSDALTQAGGMTANASYAQILLQRDGALTQISEGSPEFSATAHPGDILTVPSVEHIQVIGAVGSQGEVTLKQDFTLMSALYFAGGPTKWADLGHVYIRHRGTTKVVSLANIEHGNLSTNPGLEDGDVVFVPEGHKIDWRGFFQELFMARYFFPKIH